VRAAWVPAGTRCCTFHTPGSPKTKKAKTQQMREVAYQVWELRAA
jgi:hypothetical protein